MELPFKPRSGFKIVCFDSNRTFVINRLVERNEIDDAIEIILTCRNTNDFIRIMFYPEEEVELYEIIDDTEYFISNDFKVLNECGNRIY